MSWKKSVFKSFKLYAVTDIKTADEPILEKVRAAYQGGADIVQLRSKTLSDRKLCEIGKGIKRLAARYRKLFFVNDRLDLALATGADGLHLGQEDLPIESVRMICEKMGRSLWIGKSTHSLAQALKAQKEGADYIGVGPIFSTPTKPGCPTVGLDLIQQVKSKIKIPFVAIGGINEKNIAQVCEAGAERIAVVRAIFSRENIYAAAKQLRAQLG